MEPVEVLNRRLVDLFGWFQGENPLYRVVWSEDQLEKVRVNVTPEGFVLPYFYVREQPKYRQYIHHKWILERLIAVPKMDNMVSNLVEDLSYEPVWVFEDKDGNPLPPAWAAIELIIHTINTNAARAVGAKYKDPRADEWDPKIAVEARNARLNGIVEELFGNETSTTDALAHKTGVVNPGINSGMESK